MKLIDCLLEVLPSQGGWKIGADFVAVSFGEARFYSNKHGWLSNLEGVVDGMEGEQVNREEYDMALAKAQKPAWNGEGLPPVGCECELVNFYGNDFPEFVGEHGEEVKIIGNGFTNGCPVAFYEADGGRGSMLAYAVEQCFRPIRTEAERKREDAEVAMRLCLKGTGYGMTEGAAKTVFDAIAAGKIPHVTLK